MKSGSGLGTRLWDLYTTHICKAAAIDVELIRCHVYMLVEIATTFHLMHNEISMNIIIWEFGLKSAVLDVTGKSTID